MKILNTGKTTIVREGFFAFLSSAVSAVVSTAAIMGWIYAAQHRETLDSGGPAFAANLGPMITTLSGIALGGFALVTTVGSLLLSDRQVKEAFTFYHGCAIVLLGPAAFLIAGIVFG
jgi:hypothetical protein